jgi:N-acetylglucosaminyl-diphospho-decaprenol L-rhamnosyltransferase
MSAAMNLSPRLDVVIPARGEGAGLASAMQAMLAGASGLSLRVIVVLNGEGCPEMAHSVALLAPDFAAAGHELMCIVSDRLGKAAALNCGDRLRDTTVPVIYLDADCHLVPGTLHALQVALSRSEPCLAGPRISPIAPRDRLSRSYLEIWKRLPGVRGDVIGAGCYAVNPAGRARWKEFPADLPDDAFARSRFNRSERLQVQKGGAFFAFPVGSALPKTVRRWRSGNQRLAASGISVLGPDPTCVSPLTWLLGRPSLWRHLPALLWVRLRSMSERDMTVDGWRPLRNTPAFSPAPAHARVAVVVVAFNSADLIEGCLQNLVCRSADMEIRVIDNGSSDDTLLRLAHMAETGSIAIDAVGRNLGFAAAVNRATQAELAGGGSNYVLMVNPDVLAEPDAIDALVSLARLHPHAGLYGGRMETLEGQLDRSSCLALPSIRHFLAFACCANILPIISLLDPDRLGGWQRDDTREVPALTGGFLLVDRLLWQRLGGFDTRFFLYGEDVDLSRRARALGARPLMTNLCRYRHLGGASSKHETDRYVLILRGLIELAAHLPMSWSAHHLLLAGVAIRAFIELAAGSSHRWRIVWQQRTSWRYGWSGLKDSAER